jgi:hypothetical protein
MQTNNQIQWTKSVRSLVARLSLVALAGAWNVPAGLAQQQEHPKPPAAAPTAASAVTLEDVAQQIETYVKRESHDGAFKFEDKAAGKQLSLTLDRIHRERLSQVGPDMFFACVDFKSADGKVYDLDFFVQGTSKENLRVLPDKTSVHKENGKERYTWAFNADKGIWEQKPVSTGATEHPAREHPQ